MHHAQVVDVGDVDAGCIAAPLDELGPHVGRVRGVEGLRVVDASLFPVVPCANTNFPTLMTSEKISDAILAGR